MKLLWLVGGSIVLGAAIVLFTAILDKTEEKATIPIDAEPDVKVDVNVKPGKLPSDELAAALLRAWTKEINRRDGK